LSYGRREGALPSGNPHRLQAVQVMFYLALAGVEVVAAAGLGKVPGDSASA